jgi:hypothetical protein
MEIVIPVRKGGLGNQLFQVAAALILEYSSNKQVVLPKAMPHIHSKAKYEETIFRHFQNHLNFTVDSFVLEFLKQKGFEVYPGEPGFEEWSPEGCPPGPIILHGYFQYAPLIEKYQDKIRDIYLKGLEGILEEENGSDIAIHVRRGDYMKFSDVFHILDVSYYARAIQQIEEKVQGKKRYKVFSDDIEWCKEQDIFQSLEDVLFIEDKDELKSFCQMIQCSGGIIGANSSFSWWAAFLGASKFNAPCIFPEDWMKGKKTNLLLSNWISIPSIQGTLLFYPPGHLNLHKQKDIENIVRPRNETVEIYIDTEEYHDSSNVKLYFQLEPQAIQKTDSYILNNSTKYKTVFTYNPIVLQTCSNSKYLLFPACSWISGNHFRSLDLSKKQFQISCLTGSKHLTEGHTFRLNLYYYQTQIQEQIEVPITWFRSSAGEILPEVTKNPIILEDKFPLFENYQYSFVIENSSQENYFTEKLIDCLITKTIPIYYGCPNIKDYFDTTGWIILTEKDPFHRLNEFIFKWKATNYTKDSYTNFQAPIEKNFDTCIKSYLGFYTRINKELLKLPEFS